MEGYACQPLTGPVVAVAGQNSKSLWEIIQSVKGLEDKVMEMITGIKFLSFLMPEMALKNYAIHGTRY